MNGINQAIELAGGQTALARMVGVTQGAVWQWKVAGYVPHGNVMPVYQALDGRLLPHVLNPVAYPDPDYRPALRPALESTDRGTDQNQLGQRLAQAA